MPTFSFASLLYFLNQKCIILLKEVKFSMHVEYCNCVSILSEWLPETLQYCYNLVLVLTGAMHTHATAKRDNCAYTDRHDNKARATRHNRAIQLVQVYVDSVRFLTVPKAVQCLSSYRLNNSHSSNKPHFWTECFTWVGTYKLGDIHGFWKSAGN